MPGLVNTKAQTENKFLIFMVFFVLLDRVKKRCVKTCSDVFNYLCNLTVKYYEVSSSSWVLSLWPKRKKCFEHILPEEVNPI